MSVLTFYAIQDLTRASAEYLRDQRTNFVAGLPAPCVARDISLSSELSDLSFHRDFPGGEGETLFVQRGGAEHAHGQEGRRLLGFERFDVPAGASPAEMTVINRANELLF